MEKAEALAATAHFRRLTDEALGRLARGFVWQELADGEVVYEAGAPADALFVIARGSVVILRGDEEAATRPLARLTAGDVFGVADLFDSERRSETARTTEDSVLLRGSKNTLLGFLEHQPHVELNLRLAAAKDLTARAKVTLAVAQRRVVRHRVNQRVALATAGEEPAEATLVDLSTLGMSLRGVPDGWRPEGVVSYRLAWKVRQLALTGRVAWRDGEQIGIELVDLTPALEAEIGETLEEMLHSAA